MNEQELVSDILLSESETLFTARCLTRVLEMLWTKTGHNGRFTISKQTRADDKRNDLFEVHYNGAVLSDIASHDLRLMALSATAGIRISFDETIKFLKGK